jgi:hypothetical protein
MPLPERVAVTFTEEDAEYLSVRPVGRQSFRLIELVDMILGVTGKDAARIQHILRAGSVVFNFYRYRWEPLEISGDQLASLLAAFPDADSSRAFAPEECVAVVLAPAGAAPLLPPGAPEIARAGAERRRMFTARSLWEALLAPAAATPPVYAGYSYQRAADVFALDLSPQAAAALERDAAKLAPRALRPALARLASAARLLFLCPRRR